MLTPVFVPSFKPPEMFALPGNKDVRISLRCIIGICPRNAPLK